MKHLLFFTLLSVWVVSKASAQRNVPANQAGKHIGETVNVYGRLFFKKVEYDKAMPDSLDVVMYMDWESQPPDEDLVVIMRIKKGDGVRIDDRNIDFEKETSKRGSGAMMLDGHDFSAVAKIFLYKGKPTVSIHKNNLQATSLIGDPPPGYFQKEFLKDTNRVHEAVDKEPEFPGGLAGLNLYLKNNLKWPKAPKNISCKVFVQFVVERDGSLNHVTAIRGFDKAFYEEAVRVMKDGPKWEPGFDKGKRVRVQYTVPIDFSIIQ